jgi:hypothetical protein
MLLLIIILIWRKDCKKIGKENLAVSLSERLTSYFIMVVLPILIVTLKVTGVL